MEESFSKTNNPNRDAARRNVMFALLLAAATYLAYANSFVGVFVFDDIDAIVENESIRSLEATWNATKQTIPGGLRRRDVGRWTFALNYAFGGLDPYGYHVTNLVIHILAALFLFGIVRRTLLLPAMPDYLRQSSAILAFSIALIWAVHPLQTESVTYIVQRLESLMGMFFFACLYCVLRASAGCNNDSQHGTERENGAAKVPSIAYSVFWGAMACISVWLGLATKEVMFMAPFVVLCFDYVFLAGTWKELLQRRGWMYLVFALSLAYYFASAVQVVPYHSTTPAPGRPTSWEYLRSQPGVLLHYQWLVFWPRDLCLDYGWPIAHNAWEIYGKGAVVLASLLGGFVLLLRRSWVGFLIVAAFLVLAPSSTIVPLHLAFEHRMYVPLACIVTLVAVAMFCSLHQLVRQFDGSLQFASLSFLPLVLIASVLLGRATYSRNVVYHSNKAVWQDVANKRPSNPRAYSNLAIAYAKSGERKQATDYYLKAIRAASGETKGYFHYQYGVSLLELWSEPEEALAHLQTAAELIPGRAIHHFSLGNAFRNLKRYAEAEGAYREAIAIDSRYANAYDNLAVTLRMMNRHAEAEELLHQVFTLQTSPWFTYIELARVHLAIGESDEAIRYYESALELRPDMVLVGGELAWLLATHPDDAVRNGARALQLATTSCQDAPKLYLSWDTLAAAQAEVGEFKEAVKSAEHALSLIRSAEGVETDADTADAIMARIELYRSEQPFRDVVAARERSDTAA